MQQKKQCSFASSQLKNLHKRIIFFRRAFPQCSSVPLFVSLSKCSKSLTWKDDISLLNMMFCLPLLSEWGANKALGPQQCHLPAHSKKGGWFFPGPAWSKIKGIFSRKWPLCCHLTCQSKGWCLLATVGISQERLVPNVEQNNDADLYWNASNWKNAVKLHTDMEYSTILAIQDCVK